MSVHTLTQLQYSEDKQGRDYLLSLDIKPRKIGERVA